MSRRSLGLAAVLALASSPVSFAEEPFSEQLYMLPPMSLRTLEEPPALQEIAARLVRRNVSPVEAPRPAPPVEVVMTPVGAVNISCSIILSPEVQLAANTTPPFTEPVAAPRPAVDPASEAVKVVQRPRVEVVFVLDTTGSMSGLIAAAKDKIWAIANTLALAEPAPEIKLGLIGYRDRGDAYVTTLTDLTTDLDAVYAALMKFDANGGGDGPESVNQALHEAVHKIGWSTDDKTHRVVYLVGDAPPHMDYPNDVAYTTTCEAAVKRDILINAIQCGSMGETTPVWREIASIAEGQFFQIAQDGGAVVRETPFDAKLAELATKLDGTKRYFGTVAQQAQGASRTDASAKFYADFADEAAGALARRALYNSSDAGRANFLGEQELVDSFRSGTVKLDELKPEELPEDLRGLPKADLENLLNEKAAEREKLQTEIRKLADQRQTFLEAELAKDKAAKPEFDLKLYDSIRKQAGEKGIDYAAPAPAF